jgi:hypothetical protein
MTTMTTLTADEYRQMAREARQRSTESWERSDTDGFLSQWASDVAARKYDLQAEIAENGGRTEFLALFDLDGNLVPAKYIETKFGWAWALLNPEDLTGRFVGFFNESNARKESTRLANNRKKGFTVGRVLAPAKADIGERGGVYARRTDGGFSFDVEVIEAEARHGQ